jgi:hypothetical protein
MENSFDLPYGCRRIAVLELKLREVGGYAPQFRRPYHTEVGGAAEVAETIAAWPKEREPLWYEDDPNLSAVDLAGKTHQFLQLAPRAEETVIPHGWAARRFQFQLDVESVDAVGVTLKHMVLGYTDTADALKASDTPTLSDELVFYINSSVCMRSVSRQTPQGLWSATDVREISQILSHAEARGVLVKEGQQYLLRAEDVVATWALLPLYELENQSAFINTTTMLMSDMNTHPYEHNVPAEFVAALGKAYLEARLFPDSPEDENLEHAQRVLAMKDTDRLPLFQLLNHQAVLKKSYASSTGQFTFGDLKALFPEIEKQLSIIIGNDTPEKTYGLELQSWKGEDDCTIAATVLRGAMSGLLARFKLSRLSFSASNEGPNGDMVVNITGLECWSEDLPADPKQMAEFIELALLADLSKQNTIPVTLNASADFSSDTCISLAWNGAPMAHYVSPTFCDRLFSPAITLDQGRQKQIASDFSLLMEAALGNS